MATYNVTIRVNYDPENVMNPYTVQLLGTTDIRRGDIVNFTISLMGEASLYATYLDVQGWESTIWTSSSAVVFNGAGINGGTFSKQVRADSVFDIDYISVYSDAKGGTPVDQVASPHLGILPDADTTPDPFNLGPNISGLQPSDNFVLSFVNVSGINTGVPASVSSTGGSVYMNVEGGANTTSTTVYNGNQIVVRGTAANTYGTSITVTLNINGSTSTCIVTTTSTPPADSLIQFVSNPITLNAIKSFFGGDLLPPFAPPNNLLAYLKGGAYVPNITQNSGVPAAGSISLMNFNISYTTLYFSTLPRSVAKNASTLGGTTSLASTWAVSGGDNTFDVGYGPGMKGAAEFSYSISEDSGSGLNTGVTLEVQTGLAGTFRKGNTYVIVRSPNVSGNTEARYSGTLTISVRYKGYVQSASCKYFFNFFGP